MLSPQLVDRVRELTRCGFGIKAIARRLRLSRNSVRRYLRGQPPPRPVSQPRPAARRWDQSLRDLACHFFHGVAAGNAVVVQQELAACGHHVPLRTLQIILKPERNLKRAAALATVRFETDPGQQMQIDFGEKIILIADRPIEVHLMTVVLGFSRRLYCRPFLAERQDEWLEGLQESFEHFGGLPRQLLCDNASPLVLEHNSQTGIVRWHPGFAAFCKDRDLSMRACLPRRARTKGKIERMIGYVKHNALANRAFPSFSALHQHLIRWSVEVADRRIHATTRQQPIVLFQEREQQTLRPLPSRALAVRTRRLARKVSADCFVEVDTVRYSVPHRYVRETVEVAIQGECLTIWRRGECIAEHRRVEEPHSLVRDPRHFAGLFRQREPERLTRSDGEGDDSINSAGKSAGHQSRLAAYAELVEGGRP